MRMESDETRKREGPKASFYGPAQMRKAVQAKQIAQDEEGEFRDRQRSNKIAES